ncbi:MAG: hypothetical protein IIA17_04185 [candidate division Zixibacteria bacterium]|nr:hypothetical protein [candidate division Zixibacteria bacterium]
MKVKLIITISLALALIALIGIAVAEDEAPVTGIEGTYMLVSQDLPDGTTRVSPLVGGMFNITSKYWNLNVWWTDSAGKVFSVSEISKYSMTDSTYTETRTYSATNAGAGGGLVKYDFERKTKAVSVNRDGCQISFEMPFDSVMVVFDGSKLTVSVEGEFVDHWEKVE